jgi:hypothetical protein
MRQQMKQMARLQRDLIARPTLAVGALVFSVMLLAVPPHAQSQQPQFQSQIQPPRPDQVQPPQPESQKIENPIAVFAALDKVTGRISPLEIPIGESVQFGALTVTPRVCYTRPPTEPPLTSAFVEVDETQLTGEKLRIFTGWMFAQSPGLHAVEHPVFDVWLTNCKTNEPEQSAGSAENSPAPSNAPSSSP